MFAYMGLQVATMPHAFDFGLFFLGLPLAIASRACNITLCSRLVNSWRTNKLPINLQKMLLAVGLRGAVAYGLGERGGGERGQRYGDSWGGGQWCPKPPRHVHSMYNVQCTAAPLCPPAAFFCTPDP